VPARSDAKGDTRTGRSRRRHREYRKRIEFEGAVPLEGTSAEFAAFIYAQAEK